MGIFSGKAPDSTPTVPDPAAAGDPGRPAGKTAATPTRREAEAARRQRINPQLTPKEAKARQRAESATARQRALSSADATPARALMRDVIDSRRNLLEYALPAMMLLLVITMLVPPTSPVFVYLTAVTWVFMALLFVDLFLIWRRFKQLAAARIPNEPTRGMLAYAFNRAMTFRRMRMPKPRVDRGAAI